MKTYFCALSAVFALFFAIVGAASEKFASDCSADQKYERDVVILESIVRDHIAGHPVLLEVPSTEMLNQMRPFLGHQISIEYCYNTRGEKGSTEGYLLSFKDRGFFGGLIEGKVTKIETTRRGEPALVTIDDKVIVEIRSGKINYSGSMDLENEISEGQVMNLGDTVRIPVLERDIETKIFWAKTHDRYLIKAGPTTIAENNSQREKNLKIIAEIAGLDKKSYQARRNLIIELAKQSLTAGEYKQWLGFVSELPPMERPLGAKEVLWSHPSRRDNINGSIVGKMPRFGFQKTNEMRLGDLASIFEKLNEFGIENLYYQVDIGSELVEEINYAVDLGVFSREQVVQMTYTHTQSKLKAALAALSSGKIPKLGTVDSKLRSRIDGDENFPIEVIFNFEPTAADGELFKELLSQTKTKYEEVKKSETYSQLQSERPNLIRGFDRFFEGYFELLEMLENWN